MKRWKESDVGKRIIYRGQGLENNEVIIYDTNRDVPNTIRFVEYPLTLNHEVSVIQSPIALKSKIGMAGIIKSQEKKSKEYFEKAGDWCFVDRVSKDEMGVLEILAKSLKKPSDII